MTLSIVTLSPDTLLHYQRLYSIATLSPNTHYCTTSDSVALLHYLLIHYCTTSDSVALLHYLLIHYCTTSDSIPLLHYLLIHTIALPVTLLHRYTTHLITHYCTTSDSVALLHYLLIHTIALPESSKSSSQIVTKMYQSQTLPPTSAVKNYSSLHVYTFRYSSVKRTADDLSPVEERK